MPLQIDVPPESVADFCRRWSIVELCIFGSVLCGDFRPDSDVDILATFEPGVQWGFQQWLDMTRELETMFGRKVDLVDRRVIEQSANYIRRKHILDHLERVYVA